MASEQTDLKRNPNNKRDPENGLATFIAILAIVALVMIAFSIF